MLTLKKFSTENCTTFKKQRDVRPRISIYPTGLIRFTTPAIDLLGIKPGDKLAFYQNEKDPQEWYIGKDPSGFTCRGNAAKLMSLKNKKLAEMLYESLAPNLPSDKYIVMLIAEEPTKADGESLVLVHGLIGPIK